MCHYESIIEHIKRKQKASHILKVCEEREVPRKAEYSTEQVHICFISCTPDSEYKGEKNMTEPLSDGEKNPHLSVK